MYYSITQLDKLRKEDLINIVLEARHRILNQKLITKKLLHELWAENNKPYKEMF